MASIDFINYYHGIVIIRTQFWYSHIINHYAGIVTGVDWAKLLVMGVVEFSGGGFATGNTCC